MSSEALIIRGSSSTPRLTRGCPKDQGYNRETTAAIRKVSRLIKLIPKPDDAASSLATCMRGKLVVNDLEGYDSGSLATFFRNEVDQLRMKKLNRFCSGWVRDVEDHFVEAIQKALFNYRAAIRTRRSPIHAAAAVGSLSTENANLTNTTSYRTAEQVSVLENIAIISDDSEGIVEEEEEEFVAAKAKTSVKPSADSEIFWNQFWFLLLEHLYFCIISKTIRGKGIRSKSYDAYRFSRPTRALSRISLEEIRLKVVKELLWIVNGTSVASDKCALQQNSSNCRVYVSLQNENAIWIQIHLGPVSSTIQTAVKEFTIVVRSESPFVVVATNRMRAKKRFVSYVLSAVEAALVDFRAVSDDAQAIEVEGFCRLVPFSNTDPYELLCTVEELERKGYAGGIHSALNSFDQSTAFLMNSPILALHSSATGSVYEMSDKEKLLHSVKQSATSVDKLPSFLLKDDTSPLFGNGFSDGTVSRKRSIQEFHSPKDSLRARQCIRWDWTGATNAAEICLDDARPSSHLEENSHSETVARASTPLDQTLMPHKFKCRLMMEGENVVKGVNALMASGYVKVASAVPHFLRDVDAIGSSHSLGNSCIICVENGDVVVSKSATNRGKSN